MGKTEPDERANDNWVRIDVAATEPIRLSWGRRVINGFALGPCELHLRLPSGTSTIRLRQPRERPIRRQDRERDGGAEKHRSDHGVFFSLNFFIASRSMSPSPRQVGHLRSPSAWQVGQV